MMVRTIGLDKVFCTKLKKKEKIWQLASGDTAHPLVPGVEFWNEHFKFYSRLHVLKYLNLFQSLIYYTVNSTIDIQLESQFTLYFIFLLRIPLKV